MSCVNPGVAAANSTSTCCSSTASSATALALHSLGHDDLADRFIAWGHSNDTHGVMSRTMFGGLLEIVGLPIATIEPTDNLDTLLEDLFTVADGLDTQSP